MGVAHVLFYLYTYFVLFMHTLYFLWILCSFYAYFVLFRNTLYFLCILCTYVLGVNSNRLVTSSGNKLVFLQTARQVRLFFTYSHCKLPLLHQSVKTSNKDYSRYSWNPLKLEPRLSKSGMKKRLQYPGSTQNMFKLKKTTTEGMISVKSIICPVEYELQRRFQGGGKAHFATLWAFQGVATPPPDHLKGFRPPWHFIADKHSYMSFA